jgi:hypothetical protein
VRHGVVASVAAALVATSAACGHSPDVARAGAGTVGPATTAAAAISAPPSAATVGHTRLEAFVPTVTGWQLQHSMGADVQLPAPAAHVRATFKQGATEIELELTDTGGDATYLQALSNVAGGTFHQEAPNGYMKGAEIGGFPAIESYNRDDKLGDVTVLIKRRFIVHASATGVASVEPVRDFVSRVDLTGISALSGR